MKSKVFKIAHKVKAEFSTWSEALRFAWTKVKLQRSLKELPVDIEKQEGGLFFIFKKKSTGENRLAQGTLNLETEYTPSAPKKINYFIQKFFDVKKRAWRSLDVRTLIEY